MRERSFEKEILDLGPEFYSPEEYDDCLKKLNGVGVLLGGDRASWKALRDLCPKSILDVGCGGGYFTRKLADRYPNTDVVGIDISREAIEHAKKSHKKCNLRFIHRFTPDISDLKADVVIATLVAHHLNDEQFISFLGQAVKSAEKLVVINDLHRHRLAYCLYAVFAPLLFQNRLITHDGLLSIRRSFKREDWIGLMTKAGVPEEKWTLKRYFPFRWILKIKTG